MPTIEERKFELKQKRSDALMAKVNILRARDGSVAPPIDSMKDEDEFNVGLLFGESKNENINWDIMGVEGLIRCFYEIQYQLSGKVRNNIIRLGIHSSSPGPTHNSNYTRSGLGSAVKLLGDGMGFTSGFYCGWTGVDVEAADEDDQEKKQKLNAVMNAGSKGDLDVPMTEGWTEKASGVGKPSLSTSFTTNIDKYENWDGPVMTMIYPPDARSSSLLGDFDNLIAVIGSDSELGPHNAAWSHSGSKKPWAEYVNNTLLGYRHRDVAPYSFEKWTSHIVLLFPVYSDGWVKHGDGSWDDETSILLEPGYTPTPDYWTSAYDSNVQAIINKLNSIITYIEYTKITNFTFFVNHLIIPGIDLEYDPTDPNSNIGSSWNLQQDWIAELTVIIDRLQYSLDYIGERKESSSKTKLSSRSEVDTEILEMQGLLSEWQSQTTALSNIIDGIYGDITDPLSLYGHRYMWIRTLIHATEGTMTAVNATQMAIDMMAKKLKKSEEELLMFGQTANKWIPTPTIVGIEPYPVLNQATFEMEIGGWLVAWGGQEHCIGYDVWKSFDYDPATKSGIWKKIEVSNTNYTMTDINANNGRVLTYIIDDDVETIANDVDQAEITHPYYKVKAYDINAGSGDYDRIDAESEVCEALNPSAFPFGGDTASADTSGPRRDPVTVTDSTESGTTIPPNTLFWITSKIGTAALDFERRIFESEAPFDSTASNLIVFVNGSFKNQGPASSDGDYELLNTYKIKFHESIPLESEVNMVVALRSFTSSSSNATQSVSSSDDLPSSSDDDGGPAEGDICFVDEPAPGNYYQYTSGEWVLIPDPNTSSVWKDPVNSFAQLPTQLNQDGDIRLALKDSTLYRWDSINEAWVKVSGAAGGGWLSPVDTIDDLNDIDPENLTSGTIVFVLEEESLYRYSTTRSEWIQIAGSNAANWKGPVNSFDLLPITSNTEGDIRLVLGENKMYRWFAWEQEWKATKAEADIAHTQLNDEDWEIVEDHDARYYPKNEIDVVHNDVELRLGLLEMLKPKNAEALSGDFNITGTKLYEGYLSISDSILNYNTLKPKDYFRRIIKDKSFILSNQNTQQFKDADQGIVKCYINNEEADSFNLGEYFIEDERESGQSYPREFGINNIIEIISVGPFNQYGTYQRADFQLNINNTLLIQGENSIRLEHEVGNITGDVNKTEEFIVFYDEFDGYMGFKDIYVDEIELNSEKYLSGIRYYSIGDKLRVRFEAENLFNNSYIKDEQIYINTENFGITPEYTNYEGENILGYPEPGIGQDINYLKETVINTEGIYSSQPILFLEARNPFTTYRQENNNTNMLINTVNYKSTDSYEGFFDEFYRQPLSDYNTSPEIFNQWDSKLKLGSEDLMIFGGKLIYPNGNFTSYFPYNNIDYNSSIGTRQYIRTFKDTEPHSNGILTIDGFYSSDANIKVDIKLPGLTGWLSLNEKFNNADFNGEDGDGCLSENNGFVYEWTSGEYNTANSDDMILIRITMYRNTTEINSIRMDW